MTDTPQVLALPSHVAPWHWPLKYSSWKRLGAWHALSAFPMRHMRPGPSGFVTPTSQYRQRYAIHLLVDVGTQLFFRHLLLIIDKLYIPSLRLGFSFSNIISTPLSKALLLQLSSFGFEMIASFFFKVCIY